MSGLDFHVIYIFCLHRAFYKIHSWKLFVYGKIFAHRKIKRGGKSDIKNKINKNKTKQKNKNRPKEERKSNILSRKEKRSFVKATGTGGAPRWRPDFEQRSRRQTKICHA